MTTMRLNQGEKNPQDKPASLSWAPIVELMTILMGKYQPSFKIMMIMVNMGRARRSKHVVQEQILSCFVCLRRGQIEQRFQKMTMILIEIYQTNVKMMMFLIYFYQPDCHEHRRLQPLEVATLEAALSCPKAVKIWQKIRKILEYLLLHTSTIMAKFGSSQAMKNSERFVTVKFFVVVCTRTCVVA